MVTVNCPSERLTLTSDLDTSTQMSVCDPIDLPPLLASVTYNLTLSMSSVNSGLAFTVTFYVTGRVDMYVIHTVCYTIVYHHITNKNGFTWSFRT